MTPLTHRPAGEPSGLGAQATTDGVRFRVFSGTATSVELCVLDESGAVVRTVDMAAQEGGVWDAAVAGIGPGTGYGYRAHGDVSSGRFAPARILIDPYALEVRGDARWRPEMSAGHESAAVAHSVVVDPSFDWHGDTRPRTPWSETVIYECHVRGLTIRHPGLPESQRGTYRGLASEPVIRHLKRLGVTTVELMPVHQPFHERHLIERGLSNYWGYAPIALFAPDNRFASAGGAGPVREFKEMVRAFHAAGIEVLLDVVYNHTGEGDVNGETLSMRGLDEGAYYRLTGPPPGVHVNYSGCGNTLATHSDPVARLIIDSLRYWVTEMHVDGFRFDLATILGRTADGHFEKEGLLTTILEDPVLGSAKMVAEPWDLGPKGYALGEFPGAWREWNAAYRDATRRFWKRDFATAGDFAAAFAGSQGVFRERPPSSGINFVTCHDGFTLFDLVRYNRKHNEANQENNRDGHDRDHSCNWGTEGRTDDPRIESVRERVSRAMLACLAFSRGVPMLQQGDELRRTQGGNNNAYCHDDERTWVPWDPTPERESLVEYVSKLFALRREHAVLRRDAFYSDDDITWLSYGGRELEDADWHTPERHGFIAHIHDRMRDETDGEYLVAFNAGMREKSFAPSSIGAAGDAPWRVLLDSSGKAEEHAVIDDDGRARVPAHSVLLLVRRWGRTT